MKDKIRRLLGGYLLETCDYCLDTVGGLHNRCTCNKIIDQATEQILKVVRECVPNKDKLANIIATNVYYSEHLKLPMFDKSAEACRQQFLEG